MDTSSADDAAAEPEPHGPNDAHNAIRARPKRVRTVALYLPQFHPIPENDAAWGKGFTEWRNVAKATPRFVGHEQPHLPSDLGFYDLRLEETRLAQAEMAKRFGVDAFCHYWFSGKRLLNRPLDEVLASGRPDFPFMLCWANEEWRANWDGRSGAILEPQAYSPEDDDRHGDFLAGVFGDPRYLRIEGRPAFAVYRPGSLPDTEATTGRLRQRCLAAGVGDPWLIAIEAGFAGEQLQPMLAGFDAGMEFQPYWPDLRDAMPQHLPAQSFRAPGDRLTKMVNNATQQLVGWSQTSATKGLKYRAAYGIVDDGICDVLLPNFNGGPNQAQVQQALKFSNCMRSHGLPDFPDPKQSGQGISIGPVPGVEPQSPRFQAAESARRSLAPLR